MLATEDDTCGARYMCVEVGIPQRPPISPQMAAGRPRVFYGWWVVGASLVLLSLGSGLLTDAFTLYFVPLRREFGWSRTLLAAGSSLSRVKSGLFGPLEGWLTDRYGPRRVASTGVLLMGFGFVVFSRIESPLWFVIAFSLMAVGSSMSGFVPTFTAVVNWFFKRRGLAVGIASTGVGVGGLVAPVLAWSIVRYGWSTTALISGLIIWVVGLPMALLLRHKPEQYGYLPDGLAATPMAETEGEEATAEELSDYSFSAREALRTPAFWFLATGQASVLLVVSTVSVHQVPHMVQQMEMSLAAAGGVVAYSMSMFVVGRLSGGVLADRFNKRLLLTVCSLALAVAVLFLSYATSLYHLILFASFYGLAFGARGVTQESLRADYFGRESIGTIVGFSSMVVMLFPIAAPIFAGWMADQSGNYHVPFTILALLTGLGSILFLFAHPPVLNAQQYTENRPPT